MIFQTETIDEENEIGEDFTSAEDSLSEQPPILVDQAAKNNVEQVEVEVKVINETNKNEGGGGEQQLESEKL